MTSWQIPDANIQTSAEARGNGRLRGNSPFQAPNDASDPWIQADIGYQTCVSGVKTQGIAGDNFVTSFWVSTFGTSGSKEVSFTFH